MEAGLLDGGGEGDPESSGVAAAAGDVAPLGPVVDDVGFDAEACGDVGDAEFGVASGFGVEVTVSLVMVAVPDPPARMDPPAPEPLLEAPLPPWPTELEESVLFEMAIDPVLSMAPPEPPAPPVQLLLSPPGPAVLEASVLPATVIDPVPPMAPPEPPLAGLAQLAPEKPALPAPPAAFPSLLALPPIVLRLTVNVAVL